MKIKSMAPYISLRSIRENDWPDLWSLISNEDVTHFLTWEKYTSKEAGYAFLKRAMTCISPPDEFLAICFKDKLIGTSHIIKRHEAKLQIGFSVLPNYYQIQADTLALKSLLKYISNSKWNTEGIVELWVDVHQKNEHAIKVILDCGFIQNQVEIAPKRDRYTKKVSRCKVLSKTNSKKKLH